MPKFSEMPKYTEDGHYATDVPSEVKYDDYYSSRGEERPA